MYFIALLQRSFAFNGPIRNQKHRKDIVNHMWYGAENNRVVLCIKTELNFQNENHWTNNSNFLEENQIKRNFAIV